MKNLVLLALVAGAIFVWSRSCNPGMQQARSERSGAQVAESRPGGPVRQLQQEPAAMMERENALPPPAGVSSGAMLDTVRQGLQR